MCPDSRFIGSRCSLSGPWDSLSTEAARRTCGLAARSAARCAAAAALSGPVAGAACADGGGAYGMPACATCKTHHFGIKMPRCFASHVVLHTAAALGCGIHPIHMPHDADILARGWTGRPAADLRCELLRRGLRRGDQRVDRGGGGGRLGGAGRRSATRHRGHHLPYAACQLHHLQPWGLPGRQSP